MKRTPAAPRVVADAPVELAAFDPSAAVPLDQSHRRPVPFRCSWCLHPSGWWQSILGVVLCAGCQPSSFAELVARTGDAADAPLVELDRSSTLLEAAKGVVS